jgi:hypothetical protein
MATAVRVVFCLGLAAENFRVVILTATSPAWSWRAFAGSLRPARHCSEYFSRRRRRAAAGFQQSKVYPSVEIGNILTLIPH